MFLFKKTKSLVKRIGMNMVVYGYIGFLIFLMLSSAFPEIFENCKSIVSAVFSFVFIAGLVVTVVCFLAELFRNITKGQKTKNKPECDLSSDEHKAADNSQSVEIKNEKIEEHKAVYNARQKTLNKQLNNTREIDIKLGEYYDGGFVEQNILLRKDAKGYFIYENSWHYNANKEECISTTYIDDSYILDGSVKKFVGFLKKQYPDYEIDRYVKDNKELCALFLSDATSILADFLRKNGYDIEFASSEMSIVKQSDDPWNHFNKFIAKPDGVYNFIEVQMGGYSLTKRLSCGNYKVASFVALSYVIVSDFSLRDSADKDIQMILRVIKEHFDYILRFTMDYDRGQWFIDMIKKELL